jgi:serine protease Do
MPASERLRRAVLWGVWAPPLVALALTLALASATASRPADERRRTPVVEAVRQAAPGVVSVHADALTQGRTWRRGAGSGVILDPAGYVITNSHVIQGAHRISVQLFRGGGTYEATVVLNEPQRDLALLRISRPGGFPYVALARNADTLLGETAIAIGNPRGLGDTITVGVVSALDREARMSNGIVLRNLIQTDAPINTGSSGGALLNLDGEVLGVIVSLLPSAVGIAFAIPADEVRDLLQRAIGRIATAPTPVGAPSAPNASGRATSEAPIPAPAIPGRADDSEGLGLDLDAHGGTLVVRGVRGPSPATRAGLRAGDLLLLVDGRVVGDPAAALRTLEQARGRVVRLDVMRQGERRVVSFLAPRE